MDNKNNRRLPQNHKGKGAHKNYGSQERKKQGIRGHDAHLLDLLRREADIELHANSGLVIKGKLKSYDAFTITVEIGKPTPFTVFKSSLLGYNEVAQ
ncbi:hypothetical protein VCR15J2_390120 [Vibrio coralliirubri]|uniref:hypothetical protein n=1 Tax=Vibrio coralliirubri TaxID=1516159 RepID=UPI00062ED058|nr:hypothetical protein [Vibrio coralliirubri]CDT54012.1 hypothetical protein VCR15J2_390120 [Vibrio coralliirubri]